MLTEARRIKTWVWRWFGFIPVPHRLDVYDFYPCDALSVGVAGHLHVLTANGKELEMSVPCGVLPLRISRIYRDGTTARRLVALYS